MLVNHAPTGCAETYFSNARFTCAFKGAVLRAQPLQDIVRLDSSRGSPVAGSRSPVSTGFFWIERDLSVSAYPGVLHRVIRINEKLASASLMVRAARARSLVNRRTGVNNAGSKGCVSGVQVHSSTVLTGWSD